MGYVRCFRLWNTGMMTKHFDAAMEQQYLGGYRFGDLGCGRFRDGDLVSTVLPCM